jgi:XTP/dITP diphosphohydrolase
MKLVLASNNQGKLKELQALFSPLNIELVTQSSLDIPEAEEPYATFIQNALVKAQHAAKLSGLPAVADDAGFCIDAFGGQPGVDTKHYGVKNGYPAGDEGMVDAALFHMQGQTNRRAKLVCYLVAVRSHDDPEPLVAKGYAEGELAQARIGSGGFGFDPVLFIPEIGKTFAQLSPTEKNARSHRGQAARQMVELIKSNWL